VKIGCFGNNNNYPFLLAEALRELGHDVVLFVNKRGRLDRPESRDPGLFGTGYPDWVVDVAASSEQDWIALQPSVGPVLDRLAACDALILNDLGPSLQPLLDKPAITFLTGSDLDYYASLDTPALRLIGASPQYRDSPGGRAHAAQLHEFVERQRQGLRASVAVNWALPGLFPASERLLAEIGVTPQQLVNLQMADLRRIAPSPPPHNDPPRVLCATRLTWKLPVAAGRSELDYKGSDLMVRGLGRFHRRTGRPLDIRLVRKGQHLDETEQLLAEEGLQDQVTWCDEMALAELWREFGRSDLVFEQLGGSIVSMVALDVMAAARPVVGNTRPDVATVFSAADSPICQARTADEVAEQLQRLCGDRALRERLGGAGRAFVERHFSPERAARTCLQRFEQHVTVPGRSRQYFLQRLAAADGAPRAADDECHRRERVLLAALRTALAEGRESVVWRQLVGPFAAEGARGWTAHLPDLRAAADHPAQPERSPLLVLEDDRPLGPGHSLHDTVRTAGGGCYSHWQDRLYFSTSDGSDPNHNGRNYQVVLARPADSAGRRK
jgi:glycosyltransferase involved in cell wall biosynthesis